jgi:hypothetical protein
MEEDKFTMEDALKIQNEQLAEWKGKLIPECYDALFDFATKHNFMTHNPYDLIRGKDLDGFVGRWKPQIKVDDIKEDLVKEILNTLYVRYDFKCEDGDNLTVEVLTNIVNSAFSKLP